MLSLGFGATSTVFEVVCGAIVEVIGLGLTFGSFIVSVIAAFEVIPVLEF